MLPGWLTPWNMMSGALMRRINKGIRPCPKGSFEVGKGRLEKSNILLISLLMLHTTEETKSCLKHQPVRQRALLGAAVTPVILLTEGTAGVQEGSRWRCAWRFKTQSLQFTWGIITDWRVSMHVLFFFLKFFIRISRIWSCTDVRFGPQRRQSAKELMLLKCGAGEDS